MPVKIKSTSGSVTLDAQDVAGDQTLTVPSIAGGKTLLTTDGDGSNLMGVGVDGISSASSSGTAINISSTNKVTMPNQPAFMVKLTNHHNNATGDGSTADLDSNSPGTEIFDQGSNLTHFSFAAPVTGRYQLNMCITLEGIQSNHTYGYAGIWTSNGEHTGWLGNIYNSSSSGKFSCSVGLLVDMDANDVALPRCRVYSGSKVVDWNPLCRWSGYLVA